MSESLVQSDSNDALASLRLKKFEDMVRSSAGKVDLTRTEPLDPVMSTGQHQYLSALNEQEKKPKSLDPETILRLSKLVEKKKLNQKRLNQIGESFASPKQLNEATRVGKLRQHYKRKAEELQQQQDKKKAKKEAEEPVAKVLSSKGYLKPGETTVTVSAMKCFLRENSSKLSMPRSNVHAKKADLLAFLGSTFGEQPEADWEPAKQKEKNAAKAGTAPGAASWVVAFRQLWYCACAVVVITTFIICVLQMNWESHAGVVTRPDWNNLSHLFLLHRKTLVSFDHVLYLNATLSFQLFILFCLCVCVCVCVCVCFLLCK